MPINVLIKTLNKMLETIKVNKLGVRTKVWPPTKWTSKPSGSHRA